MSLCEHCSAPLSKPALGRPQTRFCSKTCKERARTAAKRAARLEALATRKCAQCGERISDDRNGRAVTCSAECGVTYQNRRRQEGKRAAWLANKPPCRRCGEEIPESRPANSLFCSTRCKRNHHSQVWRERAPGYMRQYLYGLTPARYTEMLANQDNRCGICRAATPGGQGDWHVDHSHFTGKVRGLLCNACNLMLGNAKDNVETLRAAIMYLEAAASE